MAVQLPKTLADYFDAVNRRDIDAMLHPFAADAVVKDEGQTMSGPTAIRAWMEETTREYGVTIDPEDLSVDGDRTIVRARLAGTFPGSPIRLSYRFRLHGEKIAGLEIG